jgi:hypothetical protein
MMHKTNFFESLHENIGQYRRGGASGKVPTDTMFDSLPVLTPYGE